MNRNFIGSEASSEYCEIANRRLYDLKRAMISERRKQRSIVRSKNRVSLTDEEILKVKQQITEIGQSVNFLCKSVLRLT